MGKILHVTVANKVATYSQRDGAIVCGNDDYQVQFTLGPEWEGVPAKARFIWNGQHKDEPIEDGVAKVPRIVRAREVKVGVYSDDESLHTTTSARIPCEKSILCDTTNPTEGNEAYYASEAQKAAERAEEAAERAEAAGGGGTVIDPESVNQAQEAAAAAKASAEEAAAAAKDAQTAEAAARASYGAAATSAQDASQSRDEALALANAAANAAVRAEAADATAEQSAENASQSWASAENAKTAAETARDTATQKATAATNAAQTATSKATEAINAANAAQTAKTAAETAKNEAQAIKTEVETKLANGDYKGEDGKSAYEYAQDGGYTGTEEAFAKKLANGEGANYVTAYGAKGDGETDDTTYFQQALATDRVVFVPGGTYKLTGGLVIRDNCELELAQDAVLVFTQTTGNCITLGMSSSIRGNHATVKVPYEFSGNVVYASSTTTESVLDVPPFSKWDPQWKSGRYVTDLNICKADYRGLHYSVNGDCAGTAVYLSADGGAHSTFMWGIHYSGLRIAGSFEYGIRAVNFNDGWLHEMRVDAFIDACETAVSLEDCNQAYVSTIIQPRRALKEDDKTYVPYAKHGIKLVRSKNVDLSGSRVWDWNETNALWTDGGEHQFLCLYGDCRGAILNAFQYYATSYDIRDLIYTDTPSNLEQITILQEPFDRWFKNRNGVPYFSDGHTETKLTTDKDIEALFGTTLVPKFTNQLPIATDTDGTIYNETGYKVGVNITGYYPPTLDTSDPHVALTGFIPVKDGSTIRTENLVWNLSQGYERIVFFNKNKEAIQNGTSAYTAHISSNLLATSVQNYVAEYELGENGLRLVLGSNVQLDEVAYVRMTCYRGNIGSNPIITVDEEIAYEQVGVLSDGVRVNAENLVGDLSDKVAVPAKNLFGNLPDGVKVKAENVIGLPEGGGSGIDVTAEVGQTIVVKAVDEHGKPTAWESADYQPRTHYSEWVELLPETALPYDEEYMQFLCPVDFEFVEGDIYRVKYNGTEYDCTAYAYTDADIDLTFVVIGNGDMLGLNDTGEPFMAYIGEGMLAVSPYEEATEVSLKIEHEQHHKIDKKYYDYGVFYVDAVQADNNTFTTTLTPNQFKEAYSEGKSIIARISTIPDITGHVYTILLPLVSVGHDKTIADYGIITFRGFSSLVNIASLQLFSGSSDTPYECLYVQTND